MFLNDQAKAVTAWLGSCHSPAVFTRHCISIDFHLSQSLQNSLIGNNFNSLKDCKRHLEQFFVQKDKKFWEDGIMKLLGKWQKVVGQNVEHIVYESS